MISSFYTAHLTDLGSKTGYPTLVSLKMSNSLCIQHPGSKHSNHNVMLIKRRVRAASHHGNFRFFLVYLFWYLYESEDANFYDTGCTWNAGHVIGMISLTSRGKPWT